MRLSPPGRAFSPDGRRVLSGGSDRTLRLWDTETGREISTLKGISGWVRACAFNHDGKRIAFGDDQGLVLMVTVENIEIVAPIVTAIRIRLQDKDKEEYHWDDAIKATCLWCCRRFTIAKRMLDAIMSIGRVGNLSPEKSPCLSLPSNAWDDPRLLSECPLCYEPLRFNPFLVDNRDRG